MWWNTGSGQPGPSVPSAPFSTATLSEPQGVVFVRQALPGGPPYYSTIIADTGNNQLRVSYGSSLTQLFPAANSANLLTNPGCDFAVTGGSIVGWTTAAGAGSSYQCYSTINPDTDPALPHGPVDGAYYFGVDPASALAQTVSVSQYATQIDVHELGFESMDSGRHPREALQCMSTSSIRREMRSTADSPSRSQVPTGPGLQATYCQVLALDPFELLWAPSRREPPLTGCRSLH